MYKKLQFKKIQNIRIVNPYVLKKKIRTSHMFCKQHTYTVGDNKRSQKDANRNKLHLESVIL